MDDQTKQKTRLFDGAGYLAGFVLGTLAAILFVAITGLEALIGAMAASLSIPAGMGLEKWLKGGNPENNSARKLLIIFSISGIILLTVIIGLSF